MPFPTSHADRSLPHLIQMDAPNISMEASAAPGAAHGRQLSRQSDWLPTMKDRIENIGSDSRDHFSTVYVETLLNALNYDWKTGVIFFCVDCHNGMYPIPEFREGGVHSGHAHFPMFHLSNAIVINTAILMSLNLDVSDVHSISHCGHYYSYLHTHCLHFLDARSEDPMEYECRFCVAPMSGPFLDDKIKYCCLQCKYLSIMIMDDFSFEHSTSSYHGSSCMTEAPEDSQPQDLRHSETSANGGPGMQQSIGGHEGGCAAGSYHVGNVGLESSDSDASPTTHSSSNLQSEGNFHACNGSGITSTLTQDRLIMSNFDGLCKPCLNLQLDADRKEAACAEGRTSTPNPADFEAAIPAQESLLMQNLERAPEECLRVGIESGATMIFLTEMEEQKDLEKDKSARSNDGVLRKAFNLFSSYIESNPPVPLEGSSVNIHGRHHSESDDDLAKAHESDLEMGDVDEVPASELKVNGDGLDLWARLILTMRSFPSDKLPLPLPDYFAAF